MARTPDEEALPGETVREKFELVVEKLSLALNTIEITIAVIMKARFNKIKIIVKINRNGCASFDQSISINQY